MDKVPDSLHDQPSIDFDFVGRVVHPEIEELADPSLGPFPLLRPESYEVSL